MKKFGRKLGIVLAVLVVLILLIGIAISLIFPVEKVSRQVEEELAKATGAEVSIGSAGLKWWPRFAVGLDDLQMKGSGRKLAAASGSPNELGDFFLHLDQFQVQVSLRPLLHKEVLVDEVRLQGLDLDLVYQGEAYVLKKGVLELQDLQISLDEALAQDKASARAGKNQRPGEAIPEDLQLAFQGHVGKLTAKKMPLENLVFAGDLDARVVTIEEIKANLGTGLLTGNLEIDFQRDPAGVLDFEFQAEEVPADLLLEPWAKELGQKLETDLDAEVRGSCTLGEAEIVQQTLSLTGQVRSGEGTLWARQWLREIAPYLGQRQDLQDIHFRSLSHDLRLEKGQYLVENLEIDGLDTAWQGHGKIGLDGALDLDVRIKFPAGFTPELGQWSFLAETMRDQDGRVNLDLHLSGMAAKPQVGLNMGTLQEATKSESGQALKKGLGGLLDKWKNR